MPYFPPPSPPTSVYNVPAGTSLTVPTNLNLLYVNMLTFDGDIFYDGDVMEVE